MTSDHFPGCNVAGCAATLCGRRWAFRRPEQAEETSVTDQPQKPGYCKPNNCPDCDSARERGKAEPPASEPSGEWLAKRCSELVRAQAGDEGIWLDGYHASMERGRELEALRWFKQNTQIMDQAERDRAAHAAEVERLRGEMLRANRYNGELYDRATKAEAELDAARAERPMPSAIDIEKAIRVVCKGFVSTPDMVAIVGALQRLFGAQEEQAQPAPAEPDNTPPDPLPEVLPEWARAPASHWHAIRGGWLLKHPPEVPWTRYMEPGGDIYRWCEVEDIDWAHWRSQRRHDSGTTAGDGKTFPGTSPEMHSPSDAARARNPGRGNGSNGNQEAGSRAERIATATGPSAQKPVPSPAVVSSSSEAAQPGDSRLLEEALEYIRSCVAVGDGLVKALKSAAYVYDPESETGAQEEQDSGPPAVPSKTEAIQRSQAEDKAAGESSSDERPWNYDAPPIGESGQLHELLAVRPGLVLEFTKPQRYYGLNENDKPEWRTDGEHGGWILGVGVKAWRRVAPAQQPLDGMPTAWKERIELLEKERETVTLGAAACIETVRGLERRLAKLESQTFFK
jgi:hypothetical protein